MQSRDLRRYIAEAVGTFALVFAGAGAIVVNDVSQGAVTHVGISLTFGMIVMAVVYAIGDVSGAHINPAITVGLCLSKRFSSRDAVPYIVAQCLGAAAASLMLWGMFPTHPTLGATVPAGSALQSLVLEVILTWLLMYVVLCVTAASKETGWLAGGIVGSVVALEALFAGPISGASMNPARSFGPAVVSWTLANQWIYVVGPLTGAALAVATYLLTHGVKEPS